MAFLLRCEAMMERSVWPRVFVSPFQSHERGETWQKNRTTRSSWHKTSLEAQNWCAYCWIQVPSRQTTLSMRLAQGMGLSLVNWLESLTRSLPLKRIRSSWKICANDFSRSIMYTSLRVISCGIIFPIKSTKYSPIFHTTLQQTLFARFSIQLLCQGKRI